MHERTTLTDELEQIPWTPANSAAIPEQDQPEDLCATCGKALEDDAPYICHACTEDAYYATSPDYCEPWSVRMDPYYQRPDRWGISVLGVLLFASLVASLIGTAGLEHARAQDSRIVTRTINDRPYTWTLPEAGCQFVRGWEDMSARAWCPSGMYAFDPDGSADRAAGVWYEVNTTR